MIYLLLQVTRKALHDISDICDHVLDTIDAAIDDFNIENEDISDKWEGTEISDEDKFGLFHVF